MSISRTPNRNLLYLGGISGIVCGVFLPAVIIQLAITGWFPEYALQDNSMSDWLNTVSRQKALVLSGIGLSIIAIIAFFPFGLSLFQILPKDKWHTTAALSVYIAGVSLALAAFTFAFGFTWGLIDLVHISPATGSTNLGAVATMGMRGFLACDDLATCLIGIANALFALPAFRAGLIPKWLLWWALVAAVLITVVLLRYIIPVFAFGVIGYPLVILWFMITGIYLLGNTNKAQ